MATDGVGAQPTGEITFQYAALAPLEIPPEAVEDELPFDKLEEASTSVTAEPGPPALQVGPGPPVCLSLTVDRPHYDKGDWILLPDSRSQYDFPQEGTAAPLPAVQRQVHPSVEAAGPPAAVAGSLEEFIALEEAETNAARDDQPDGSTRAASPEREASSTEPGSLPWAKASGRIRSPLLRLHNGATCAPQQKCITCKVLVQRSAINSGIYSLTGCCVLGRGCRVLPCTCTDSARSCNACSSSGQSDWSCPGNMAQCGGAGLRFICYR